MGCCFSNKKGEPKLSPIVSTKQSKSSTSSLQVNIFNIKTVTNEPKREVRHSETDNSSIKLNEEQKKKSNDDILIKESEADLRTVCDNYSVDMKSIESLTMRSPSSDLKTVVSAEDVGKVVKHVDLQIKNNEGIPKSTSDRKKQCQRHKVKLNPVGKVVKAPSDESAVEARKSHKRNIAEAIQDNRRRESVVKTIHNIGGYIFDRKTGKRKYIKPNSKYEQSDEICTPPLTSLPRKKSKKLEHQHVHLLTA